MVLFTIVGIIEDTLAAFCTEGGCRTIGRGDRRTTMPGDSLVVCSNSRTIKTMEDNGNNGK